MYCQTVCTNQPETSHMNYKLPELLELRKEWRACNKTVVWTNGCFDLVHPGHVQSFIDARKLGDILVVGLNSDASVRSRKGPARPIMDEQSRSFMLEALRPIDAVIIFDDDTPVNIIKELQPDIFCKGAEYKPPNGPPVPEREIVEGYGGRIEFLPMVPEYSTSNLIRRIQAATA